MSTPLDLSWKLGWPHSTDLTLLLLEEIIYKMAYYQSLKAAVKMMKTVAEFLRTSVPIVEKLAEIDEAKQRRASHSGEA